MSVRTFLNDRVTLHAGDCREALATLPEASVDSVVCDPPYELKFMNRSWDGTGIANDASMWAQVLRVLKPGGHLLAFSGTRTYHRMVCAIEDAGFEIRDQIGWCFGSGFPKSHSVDKAVAPATEAAKQWAGYGTALKPAWEPIVLARKPLTGTVAENVLRWGTGALNIDGCRVETADVLSIGSNNRTNGSINFGMANNRAAQAPSPLGRWPANLVHDGSPEVMAAFPETGQIDSRDVKLHPRSRSETATIYGKDHRTEPTPTYSGIGSAARFFYTAKADAEDRLGSKHPTVKPLDLMQWLVRLVTPRGGICLDPFSGTGTTGEAAWREGMRAILIEREPEYIADIERRMDLAANPTKRQAVAKTKNKLDDPNELPLFKTESIAS